MKLLFLLVLLVLSQFAFAANGKFNLLLEEIHTRSSDHPRSIYIYLPVGFKKTGVTRYPVLYMHDGQNLFDPERSTFGETWQVDKTLNDLIARKVIPPIIVIGIDNTADRTSEYTHAWESTRKTGGDADLYLDFLIYDLKRYIDHRFPTLPDAAHTGIMGSSLGGLVSLYAGARNSDVFGLIGAMSPSVWWNKKSILSIIEESNLPQRVYIDSGALGGEMPKEAKEAALLFQRLGLEEVMFVLDNDGEHNEKSWARRLPEALAFLFSEEK
jgi:predicted alpha/beta superfamily hydrolase